MPDLITEQFLSIQGEGRSIGHLAYFIRFAGCNLRCGWCDTVYSVEPALFRGQAFPVRFEDVPEQCQLVVLTGGEPTLFDIGSVRRRLSEGHPHRVFEVETNGVRFPENLLADFRWNVSPKLSSSRQKNKRYDDRRLERLPDWAGWSRSGGDVVFKFVLSTEEDRDELLDLLRSHRIPRHRVYVMAEGTTPESQSIEKVSWLIDLCQAEGLNYSPRLHVILWGNRRGI